MPSIDPLRADAPSLFFESVERGWGERFILHPGELVLAVTLEYVRMPQDLGAQVITRSKYGRMGLLAATAIAVHPGSSLNVTLELVNAGNSPIVLWPGLSIAQLTVYQAGASIDFAEPGTFGFSTGPTFPILGMDEEEERLSNFNDLARSLEAGTWDVGARAGQEAN